MYKILFIITKGQTGGAQKFVCEQIEILSGSYECYLSTNSRGWLSENTQEYVKDTLFDSGIEGVSLSYLITLYKFIKKNKIDLVVCNSANGGLYGRIASFLSNTKSIYVTHGWSSVYNGGRFSFIFNFIETLLSFTTSSILCISQNDYLIAKNKIKIPDHKLHVINNATIPFLGDIAFPESPEKQKYKLLTVARLSSPKRIDLLIDAVKEFQNVDLTVVGDGPDMSLLLNNVKSEKIKNVFFKGEVKSFQDFAHYDIFALISESEGLPMSAIEAMSVGMPLILSNVGGCPELIRDSGMLVENDIDDIKTGISGSILKFSEFSVNSYDYYQDQFNLLKNISLFKDYYQSVINK